MEHQRGGDKYAKYQKEYEEEHVWIILRRILGKKIWRYGEDRRGRGSDERLAIVCIQWRIFGYSVS
jgi:hypothetical protein